MYIILSISYTFLCVGIVMNNSVVTICLFWTSTEYFKLTLAGYKDMLSVFYFKTPNRKIEDRKSSDHKIKMNDNFIVICWQPIVQCHSFWRFIDTTILELDKCLYCYCYIEMFHNSYTKLVWMKDEVDQTMRCSWENLWCFNKRLKKNGLFEFKLQMFSPLSYKLVQLKNILVKKVSHRLHRPGQKVVFGLKKFHTC